MILLGGSFIEFYFHLKQHGFGWLQYCTKLMFLFFRLKRLGSWLCTGFHIWHQWYPLMKFWHLGWGGSLFETELNLLLHTSSIQIVFWWQLQMFELPFYFLIEFLYLVCSEHGRKMFVKIPPDFTLHGYRLFHPSKQPYLLCRWSDSSLLFCCFHPLTERKCTIKVEHRPLYPYKLRIFSIGRWMSCILKFQVKPFSHRGENIGNFPEDQIARCLSQYQRGQVN